MQKLLKICVLTYNRPAFLRECLRSILAQTFTNFDLIVLDNASEENIRDVVNELPDPRVTYFRQPSNIGALGNFESALRDHSDSKYLTIFHDDDIMPPTLLEHQIRVLEQNPTLSFVSTEYSPFRGDVPAMSKEYSEVCSIFQNGHELIRSIIKGLRLDFSSVMYKSSVVRRHCAPDYQRFGPLVDRPFLVDVCGNDGCLVLHAPRVLRRVHVEQDSKSSSANPMNILNLYKFYLDHLSPLDSFRKQWEFYSHSGSSLPLLYWLWSSKEGPGIVNFLKDCRSMQLLQYKYLCLLPIKLAQIAFSKVVQKM